jgi:hypothetical protein
VGTLSDVQVDFRCCRLHGRDSRLDLDKRAIREFSFECFSLEVVGWPKRGVRANGKKYGGDSLSFLHFKLGFVGSSDGPRRLRI